jgi:methylmalonyl-CoA/ethylmalonyl-CoA epimerase
MGAKDDGAVSSTGITVEGLHHYTISVADIDESAAWYSKVLGFKSIYQNNGHQWGKVAYMQAPGFLLEMFEPPDPQPLPSYAAGPEPDTDLMVSGHKHFALLHRNLTDAVEELKALDANVVSFKIVSFEGMGEFRAVFLADRTGGLIELPEDDSPAAARGLGTSLGKGPLAIKGLHHVAICVQDRDEAVEWYSKMLGFTVATTFEVPPIGLRSAMMQGPGFWMEVHCMAGAAPVPAERRDPVSDTRTLGNKYFALGVRDAGRAAERLKESGVDILAVDGTVKGIHRVFISDNSGIPIELFQLVN